MNDAQRKAMEQAVKEMERAGALLKTSCFSMADVDPKTYDKALAALRAQLDAPAEKVEPFIVKHYGFGGAPIIKGNGFDGLRIGEEREEAERFVAWINGRLGGIPTAAQIAAQARAEAIEECAKVCEYIDAKNYGASYEALECAKAIRDRALKSRAPTDTKPASQWISVDERLPDEDQWVLIAIRFDYQNAPSRYSVTTAPYAHGRWGQYHKPTHWQPLPAAPISAPTEGEKG